MFIDDESIVASCTANRYLAVFQPVWWFIQCVSKNRCTGQHRSALQLFDSLSVVILSFFFFWYSSAAMCLLNCSHDHHIPFFFILKHNSLNRCRHLWDVCVVLIDSLQPRGDHSCFHQAHRRQWSQSFFHIFQPWSFRVFFHELLDLPLSTSCSWLTFVGVLRLSLFSSVYGTNLFFFCTFLPQKTFCLQFSDTIHLTGCIWCWPPQCNLLWSGC